MKQQSLASQGVFEKYGRKSRRELFLEEMEGIVPWSALESLVRPHYAKAGNGRQPVGLSIMLRTYFVQQWFNLSDPGVEEALYESAALRRFVGVDLGMAPAPDETTICRFRHLLEKHDLGGLMLEAVNVHLEAKGIRIATGTIVDATIIHAPCSTKNQSGERDPEMHQTRKGNQWYFGLKAHIGVDSKEGVVHSVCTSAASVADKHLLPDLLHGEERKVWGDGGYQGQTEAIQEAAPHAQDMTWPQDEVQKLCGRRSETKEHNQVESKSESRTCVPHPETRLRLRQGALSWHREEPSPALRELRPDQSLPASQTPGRTGGVVRPQAAETALEGSSQPQVPPKPNQITPSSMQDRRHQQISPLRRRSLASVMRLSS